MGRAPSESCKQPIFGAVASGEVGQAVALYIDLYCITQPEDRIIK